MTAPTLLTETEAAISATLTSQEYHGPGGRRKRMADLKELRAFRQELKDEIAVGTEGGSMASLLSIEAVE
jgi:hypothetical protein